MVSPFSWRAFAMRLQRQPLPWQHCLPPRQGKGRFGLGSWKLEEEPYTRWSCFQWYCMVIPASFVQNVFDTCLHDWATGPSQCSRKILCYVKHSEDLRKATMLYYVVLYHVVWSCKPVPVRRISQVWPHHSFLSVSHLSPSKGLQLCQSGREPHKQPLQRALARARRPGWVKRCFEKLQNLAKI